MHPAARNFVAEWAGTLAQGSVLEIGSLDVNGSVRDLFPWADPYVGLDVTPGPGVDIVADATTWQPDREYDVVVCTEVLEHVEDWRGILQIIYKALRREGILILTCATLGRAPHGQHGATSPTENEWYRNVAASEFLDEIFPEFSSYELRITEGFDLQFAGIRA